MRQRIIPEYLELINKQRKSLFSQLEGTKMDKLWQRPETNTWSIGEHVDHTRVLLRSLRRIFTFLWPLLRPYAWLRRKKPYKTNIDDVYQRADFPNNAGWIWPPTFNAKRPVSVDTLHMYSLKEHEAVCKFYAHKDENILGNFYLYDPAIGWVNLIQSLRVGAYHDSRHFKKAISILTDLRKL